ncbi:MAG: RNA-binding S4 domain-containing protein [Hyphomicrobiales bacterium]
MEAGRQRVDKWLWFARVTKTRSLAQKLAVSGHVRLNREKVEAASQAVRVGDVLTVALPRGVLVLKVADLGERRGPAVEARLLYEDLSPPKEAAATGQASEGLAGAGERDAGSGRPTKRERRQLDRLRGGDGGP